MLLTIYIHMHVFHRTFVSALLPEPRTKMQPVPLHSLSELERASLQEIALYQLQEKLLVGDLSLTEGRGGRGWGRAEPLLTPTPALPNTG